MAAHGSGNRLDGFHRQISLHPLFRAVVLHLSHDRAIAARLFGHMHGERHLVGVSNPITEGFVELFEALRSFSIK